MTDREKEMIKIVRESDVIDKTSDSKLAKSFNYIWNKYIEGRPDEEEKPRYVKGIAKINDAEPTQYKAIIDIKTNDIYTIDYKYFDEIEIGDKL